MNCYLYGMIESNAHQPFGSIGFEHSSLGKSLVEAWPRQNFAALIGSTPYMSFKGLDQKTLCSMLLAHQETLENIMKQHDVLPCKFGMILKNKEEAMELLDQNQTYLETWFAAIKNCSEMDVLVTWNPRSILQALALEDPEIIAMQQQVPSLSIQIVGARLSEKLKEQAHRYTQDILGTLKKWGKAYVQHDVMNDEMVLNVSFLLARQNEDCFIRSLEEIDKNYEEKLHFKCIGPLPPYSFATLNLKRFDSDEIAHAKDILGLAGMLNMDDVKQAHRTRVQHSHPDRSQTDGAAFKTIQQAYELLTEYCQGNCQPFSLTLSNLETFHAA